MRRIIRLLDINEEESKAKRIKPEIIKESKLKPVRTLQKQAELIPEDERWSYLSEKQKEIILFIAIGLQVKEIEKKLNKTNSAIQTHKVRAFQWLAIRCNADATAYCLKYGLIKATVGGIRLWQDG